jgi:hypothetical protein
MITRMSYVPLVNMFSLMVVHIEPKHVGDRNNNVKLKLSLYRPEQAHGRSGRLRPRIFLTFGTRRW